MDKKEDIDLDGIRIEICRGQAICSLMCGFSDEEDLDSEAVRSLGFQLLEKFSEIQRILDL